MTIQQTYENMKPPNDPPPVGDSEERKFYDALAALDTDEQRQEFDQFFQRFINIPVVVAAMTREHAQLLLDAPQFQAVKAAFDPFPDSDTWLNHYGATAEEWIPHIYTTLSEEHRIAYLLQHEVLKWINRSQSTDTLRPDYWPDVQKSEKGFWDDPAGDDNDDENRHHAWKGLSERFVLVIDGLSLFDETISTILQNLPLQNKQVAVLVFSPLPCVRHPVDTLIESRLKARANWIFSGFVYDLDILYDVGVNHDHNFRRWLLAGLSTFGEAEHRLKQQRTRNAFGGPSPSNLHTSFWGPSPGGER